MLAISAGDLRVVSAPDRRPCTVTYLVVVDAVKVDAPESVVGAKRDLVHRSVGIRPIVCRSVVVIYGTILGARIEGRNSERGRAVRDDRADRILQNTVRVLPVTGRVCARYGVERGPR